MDEPKNKKARYGNNHWKNSKGKHFGNQFQIQAGLRGFICTCNSSEKDCIREAYNILNHYSDVFGSTDEEKIESPADSTAETNDDIKTNETDETKEKSEDIDIADELAAEVNSLKELQKQDLSKRRFQAVKSLAKNFIFIQSTVENPVNLATIIAKDIFETKVRKSKFLIRLVPVEIICKATPASIVEGAKPIIDKHFKCDEPKTFAVEFNRRNNSAVNKDEVISKLADLVFECNSNHKVSLKNADFTIIVEILRQWCLVSVVPDYFKLKRFNLFELGNDEKTSS